jgi:hypothetical protein
MKKMLFLCVVAAGIFLVGCVKNTTLPAYTPPFSKIFSVSSLKHTQDTVNVGDTIYLDVAGTMYDTTQNIYPYISVASPGNTFTYGTSPSSLPTTKSPVKLARVIGSATNSIYGWTSTIMLVGATNVAPNTTLTVSGVFNYQLTLSTEGGGTASVTDAGQSTKTIFVQ